MREILLDYKNDFSDPRVNVTLNQTYKTSAGGIAGANQGIQLTVNPPQDWWDEDYQFRTKFTVDHTKIGADITDFRLCVILTSSNFQFSEARQDGFDIRVIADDNETRLEHDLVYFNQSGEYAYLFCVVPLISSTIDTDIFVYYGKSLATDVSNKLTVWPASIYIMVLTLDEANGTFYDRSANGNDATNNGTLGVSGKLNGARAFDGTNDTLTVTDKANQDVDGLLTISIINQPYSHTNVRGLLVHDFSEDKYNLRISSGQFIARIRQASGASQAVSGGDFRNEWCIASLAFNKFLSSDRLACFADSSTQTRTGFADAFAQDILPGDEGYIIGRTPNVPSPEFFTGIMDMITVEKVYRDRSWHRARFWAEVEQTLLSATEEVIVPPVNTGFIRIDFDEDETAEIIAAVIYGAKYNGEISVTVFSDVLQTEFFGDFKVNNLIDLRNKTNQFPLEFPITWGLGADEVSLKIDLILEDYLSTPPIIEKIYIWYIVHSEYQIEETCRIGEIETGLNLETPIYHSLIVPNNFQIVPFKEKPVVHRSLSISSQYSFKIDTKNLETFFTLSDVNNVETELVTKAFSDEFQVIPVFVNVSLDEVTQGVYYVDFVAAGGEYE
jgi:hypothetical protein